MWKHTFAGILVAAAFGVGVPAAAAQQTLSLNSTYTAKFPGHNGTPSCAPSPYLACGQGTDPTFGPFSYGLVFTNAGSIATLTFATGTLVLDETPSQVTGPGNGQAVGGGVTNQPPWAFGHPGTFTQTWTVDPVSSSGSFFGATGSGTDPEDAAGIILHATLSGTITLP